MGCKEDDTARFCDKKSEINFKIYIRVNTEDWSYADLMLHLRL